MEIPGLPNIQRSKRHANMYDTAKQFYAALEEGEEADNPDIEALKEKLNRLMEPFSDDPAWVAHLEMKRIAALSKIEKKANPMETP